MSTDSLPPPRRARRKSAATPIQPRRGCACHMPLPPLPKGLQRRGLHVNDSRQFIDWPNSLESVQVTPDSLSPDAVGRLFERIEARRHRIRAMEARTAAHWFWIRVELSLIAARLHPKALARWRDVVRYKVPWAERHVDDLRRLEALILAHEPETDAWLRRQLAGLPPLGPA